MSDLTVEKANKKTMTRGEKITTLIEFLFFIGIMLSVLYSLYVTKEREQLEKQLERKSEEQRLNSFDADLAIAVAEKINSHEAFGKSTQIHPQRLVGFRVRELEAIAAGIGKNSWQDPYFRVTIRGKLPDYDTEVEKWNPPFFVINSRLVYVSMRANCAKTSRYIAFPSYWTLQNPDMVLVRVMKEAEISVESEEELGQLLGTSSESIKALEVWKKTCKWTVVSPSTQ